MNQIMSGGAAGNRLRGNAGGENLTGSSEKDPYKLKKNPLDIFPDIRNIKKTLTQRNRSGDVIPNKYESGQLRTFTGDQLDLFKQLFEHVSQESYLSRLAGGDESYFEDIEQPYWRQQQEQQGQLGSQYSQFAPGAMSAQRGSGFQNAAGQQASNFAMSLSSQRQSMQRQAISDLAGFSRTLLQQRPYERMLVAPRDKGEKQTGIKTAWQLAGTAIGSYFGSPGAGYQGGTLVGEGAQRMTS